MAAALSIEPRKRTSKPGSQLCDPALPSGHPGAAAEGCCESDQRIAKPSARKENQVTETPAAPTQQNASTVDGKTGDGPVRAADEHTVIADQHL
jgi:hypothetical protein